MAIDILKGKDGNKDIHLWAPVHEVESQALDQLKHVASLPRVFHHVAAMPDVHLGVGATVGSVVAMKDAVSPAAVGVDIGCGMGAIKTSLKANDLPDNLHDLRLAIEASIPVGFSWHDEPAYNKVRDAKLAHDISVLFGEFILLDPQVDVLFSKAKRQLGTLGGGNHFIELCLDTQDNVWMMLHSGSRNIGKELAEIHMSRAKKLEHNATLTDRDLAYFIAGTPEMKAYRNDLEWAQRYAFLNRRLMFELYKEVLNEASASWGYNAEVVFEAPILCHHNYVSMETHFGEEVLITRKGAIDAHEGVLGIIPGSMGTKSYIVRGLGNPDSFMSASHGAGRRMSRGAAKRTFSVQDFETQTAGVCCRKDSGVLDEIPGAYKDIDAVMENQKDLVKIEATLKQVLCVKG